MTRVIQTLCACALMFSATSPVAASDGGGITDDWDWGAIEAMDDTPLDAAEARSRVTVSPPSQRITNEESSSPDLEATPREAYTLFAGMPSFRVLPSRKDKEMHPCTNCHKWVPPIKKTRALPSPHNNFELEHSLHGKGRFWCFTCHDDQPERRLRTLEGESIEFDDAYILCSQCHVNQARDWAFGGHGKRLDNWQGERVVYNCTACHYQHAPAFAPREAMPGPTMRQGLPRPAHWSPPKPADHQHHETLWLRHENNNGKVH